MKFLFLTILLISSTSYGKTFNLTHRFGVGGGGGTTYPLGENDFDEMAEQDFSYNVHLRYQTHKADGLQLSYKYLDFEETSLNVRVYDLMYLYRLNGVDKFTPIIGLGAGVADLSNFDPFDNLKAALRARVGFEYALTEDLFTSLVADYHYINRMPDDDDGMPIGEMHVLAPQINLTLFFGPSKEEKNKPSPARNPVAVIDYSRITSDLDKDGVIDPKDKCPGTDPGSKVNAYGCEMLEKAKVDVAVFFNPGSSEITMNSYDSLRELAQFMEDHPKTEVEIQGHTDNVGSKDRNRKISQERADAVRAFLVEEFDISPTRLTAYGYGDTQPIADNDTESGRARNRRVIAVISE